MTIWNYLYGFPIHFLRITPILYSKKLVKYLRLRSAVRSGMTKISDGLISSCTVRRVPIGVCAGYSPLFPMKQYNLTGTVKNQKIASVDVKGN